MQSALDPKGENAAGIAEITWILFGGGTLIFIAVMVLALVALSGTGRQRAALGRQALIVGAGIAFPVVVLSALLVYTFASAAAMVGARGQPAARIEVVGELWWWRIRYLDDSGKPMLETANEIRIPAGSPVELILMTSDVIHSFWVPNLAGKLDMLPGTVNRLRITANEAGVFRGQCAEYCGMQHANMALQVVVSEPNEYRSWLEANLLSAQEPGSPQLQHGRQLFLDNRCGLCHTIRGTSAAGTHGPDLTHVGSRLSLAAGTLPKNPGSIAGWIAGGQHLKPGNKMPSFAQFSGEDLRALAAYLESLQ